jgi:hypothetical protein
MEIDQFAKPHFPSLTRDEVKYNLILSIVASAQKRLPAGLDLRTRSGSGHCAVRSAGRAIWLGRLDRFECKELAIETHGARYWSVLGGDETAHRCAEKALAFAAQFKAPVHCALTRARKRRSPRDVQDNRANRPQTMHPYCPRGCSNSAKKQYPMRPPSLSTSSSRRGVGVTYSGPTTGAPLQLQPACGKRRTQP